MAWTNPATWSIVDKLQGQNQISSGAYDGAMYYDEGTNTLNTNVNGSWTPQLADGVGGGGGGSWGGGSTLGASTGTTTQAPPDPYAQWGGQTKYNDLVNQFGAQKQTIFDSTNESANQAAKDYNLGILNFLNDSKSGQNKLNQRGANNELAKMQGVNGVMGMVGRGIRSGNVTLNNKNAGDSSAAGAIANAYGQIGRGELSNIGNQYELGNQEIKVDQDAFTAEQQLGVLNMQNSKEKVANNIVSEATQKLSDLNARMVDASMPDRIAIEQEKARIKQETLGKLQAYDQTLTTGVSNIKASTADQRRQSAGELSRAGTSLGADAFNFSTEAPMSFQGNAPSGGGIPLFTMPRSRRTAQGGS